MASKDDPIVGMSMRNMKNDLLFFKEETLKELKNSEKKSSENFKIFNIEINEKLQTYEQRISNYESKISELSKLIDADRTIKEKVDKLMEFKEKVNDSLLTEKIRLDSFNRNLNQNVDRIDKILRDSVIYPGLIGGLCKYKTFHDLIDYILAQCSLNSTFREKSILDFKGYKTKLENTISAFNLQVNSILKTTSEYTNTCVKECEERMKSIYNIYDDRLQDARLENANYAIGLEKATEALKKELENLYVVKRELYDKVDSGILEMKNDNNRVVKLFTGYKKQFHIIQHKFTQLSEFIKDVRFRINIKNEEVKRREYTQMSDLINFDKKNMPGFYDGVYDNNLFKRGLASQLKDYIEGKISADQLFKRRPDLSQSVSINRSRTLNIEKNKNQDLIPENKGDGKVKLNFIDILKKSIKKRKTQDLKLTFTKKEIIKEEDDDFNNSSKYSDSVFSQKIEKEIPLDLLEKDQKEIKGENKNEVKKEDKKVEKNKNIEKKEKDNITMQKPEESKIQIISKDKDKDNKDNIDDNNSNKKERKSMKNVIDNLFNAKDIMENIKNQNSEASLITKNENQSEKKKNNNNIDDNKKIISEENNKSKNNKNDSNKGNNNTLNNDGKKNKVNNKNSNRPATDMDIKNNNKKENISDISSKEMINDHKNLKKMVTNQRNENQELQSLNANDINDINATMEPLTYFVKTINNKPISERSTNSLNKKKSRIFLKQDTYNSNYTKSYRTLGNIRKEEAKTLENMVNNLNQYLPDFDTNVDRNNNFFGTKKRK